MIREAEVKDALRIAEIHVNGWRFAYKNFINEEFLFNTMSIEYDISLFKKMISAKSGENYVLEEDGEVKGIMTMGKCRDNDKPEAFELWGLYIDPSLVRKGIGAELLKYCESAATQRGYKEITLWVFEKNKIGRSFYEKNSYIPDGKRKEIKRFKEFEMRYKKDI